MAGPVYDAIGAGYALRRQADPRIAAQINAALGDARDVVNIGAGAGSYEPGDRTVQAVEPSEIMIRQRPPGAAPCVQAPAEALPYSDASFDAAMAVLTIHHWSDWRAGLREMRRVARQRIVLLTFDAESTDFWLMRDYFPALLALDRQIMPKLSDMAEEFGDFHAAPVLIPHDCIDGFLGAYWRRPHIYLDETARRSMSSFAKIEADEGLRRLARDLESGAWKSRNGDLLSRETFDAGYRLVRWELGG